MRENNLQELEIEEPELKVRLKLGLPAEVFSLPPGVIPPVSALPHEDAKALPHVEVPSEENLFIVRAPIVGTFYRSPTPDKPSFVEEGTEVKKGQTLCIIEAMKLMNEIEAPVAGEVVSVFLSNAEPVEFDEPLMTLKPKS